MRFKYWDIKIRDDFCYLAFVKLLKANIYKVYTKKITKPANLIFHILAKQCYPIHSLYITSLNPWYMLNNMT